MDLEFLMTYPLAAALVDTDKRLNNLAHKSNETNARALSSACSSRVVDRVIKHSCVKAGLVHMLDMQA